MGLFRYPSSMLWAAFATLWIFSSETLGEIFDWLTGLPVVLEVLLWIFLLPWVGSLYIWHTSMALWLKIVLIVLIAMVITGSAFGNKAKKRVCK